MLGRDCVEGVLITTDIATKQLILFLNDQNGKNIVLKDLDDKHILIHPKFKDYIRTEVDRLYDQNTYQRK